MAHKKSKNAFIHIGPGKTGSTSIQVFLRQNREKLAERGLIVPAIENSRGHVLGNHLGLVRSRELKADGSIRPDAILWPQIASIADAGQHDILLSSEHYRHQFANDPDEFYAICRFFEKRNYRPVVVAYIRDQPSWINSRYVQNQTRLFDDIGFDDFAKFVMRDGSLDPWKYLKLYMDNESCDLTVIPFERGVKRGLELDFIEHCGIKKTDGFDATGLRRPNPGAKTVYAAQQIMKKLNFRAHKLEGYKAGMKRFYKLASERGWGDTPFSFMTEDRIRRIRRHYKATNATFAERFFQTDWASICPERKPALSVFDPNSATAQELDEIKFVVNKVTKKFGKLRRKQQEASSDVEIDETDGLV